MTQVKLRMWSLPRFLLFSLTLFVDGDFFDIVVPSRVFFLIFEAFVCTYLYACVYGVFYWVLRDFVKRCVFWITISLKLVIKVWRMRVVCFGGLPLCLIMLVDVLEIWGILFQYHFYGVLKILFTFNIFSENRFMTKLLLYRIFFVFLLTTVFTCYRKPPALTVLIWAN